MSVAMGHIYTVVGSPADLTLLDNLIAQHHHDEISPFAYLTVQPIPNPTTAPNHRRFTLDFSHRYQPVNALWEIIESRCPSLIAFAWVWDEITIQDENSAYIYFTMNGPTHHGRSGCKPTFPIDPRMVAALKHNNPNWLDINHGRRLRSALRTLQSIAKRSIARFFAKHTKHNTTLDAHVDTDTPF